MGNKTSRILGATVKKPLIPTKSTPPPPPQPKPYVDPIMYHTPLVTPDYFKDLMNNSHRLDVNATIVDDIKRLQSMEQSLYKDLEAAKTDQEKQGQIMNQIDQLTQIRMNLFKQIVDQFSGEKIELEGAKKAISNQLTLAKVAEEQLTTTKNAINKLNQIRNDKLRMVEIGSYEADRYKAYVTVMFYILLTSISMVVINKISQIGIIPDFLSTSLMALTIIVGFIIVGKQLLDIGQRSPLNFDKYEFTSDEAIKATQPGYETVLEHDKRAFAKLLYGAETSYEEAKDKLSGYTKSAGEEVNKIYGETSATLSGGVASFSSAMHSDGNTVTKVKIPYDMNTVQPNNSSKNIETFATI